MTVSSRGPLSFFAPTSLQVGAVCEHRSDPACRCVVTGLHKSGGVFYRNLTPTFMMFGGAGVCGPSANARFLEQWRPVAQMTVGGMLKLCQREYLRVVELKDGKIIALQEELASERTMHEQTHAQVLALRSQLRSPAPRWWSRGRS